MQIFVQICTLPVQRLLKIVQCTFVFVLLYREGGVNF